eukprot:7575313-Pyramimonas_sp.AAC.1
MSTLVPLTSTWVPLPSTLEPLPSYHSADSARSVGRVEECSVDVARRVGLGLAESLRVLTSTLVLLTSTLVPLTSTLVPLTSTWVWPRAGAGLRWERVYHLDRAGP